MCKNCENQCSKENPTCMESVKVVVERSQVQKQTRNAKRWQVCVWGEREVIGGKLCEEAESESAV